MQLYLAPMEGLTGYIVRNAYFHYFNAFDKYFTPFIPYARNMNAKQLRDVAPENNRGLNLVVQVMSNKAQEVIHQASQLGEFGHHEININMGCPSGTVSGKGRGSGLLQYPDMIDALLEETCGRDDFTLSVKTRVGYHDTDNWEQLLAVFHRHPQMSELIIHPRIQKDAYKGDVRMETFDRAVQAFADSPVPLVYNGDLFDSECFAEFHEKYPQIDRFMIGRGAFMYPGLGLKLKGQELPEEEYRRRMRLWHDEILNGYLGIFSGQKDAIFHLKENWFYLHNSFQDSEKHWKKIKKAQNLDEYLLAVDAFFRDLELSSY